MLMQLMCVLFASLRIIETNLSDALWHPHLSARA